MENNTLQEQNFKEIISNSLWKLFGMIFLGFLLGYLVYRDSEKDGNPEILYLVFCESAKNLTFIAPSSPDQREGQRSAPSRKAHSSGVSRMSAAARESAICSTFLQPMRAAAGKGAESA